MWHRQILASRLLTFRLVRNNDSIIAQYKTRLGFWKNWEQYSNGVGRYEWPAKYVPTWTILPYQQTSLKAIQEIKDEIYKKIYGLYGSENVQFIDDYRPLP